MMSSLFPIYCTPVVTRLLNMMVKGIDEDEAWLEKAIKSLAKKLRKTRQLENFENILHTGDSLSKCITIARSLDGRLQIAHRKVLPHVAYCRLFRWADLHSYHELKSLGNCEFSFYKKKDLLCINPYHYYRAQVLVMPPIYVPKLGKEANKKNKAIDKLNNEITDQYPNNENQITSSEYIEDKNANYESNGNSNMEGCRQTKMPINSPIINPYFILDSPSFSMEQNNLNINMPAFHYPMMARLDQKFQATQNFVVDPIVNLYPVMVANDGQFNGVNVYHTQDNINTNQFSPSSNSSEMNCTYYKPETLCDLDTNNVPQQDLIDQIVAISLAPVMNNRVSKNMNSMVGENGAYEAISYQAPQYWCKVSYYELDLKIGNFFKSNSKVINIDFSNDVINSNCFGLQNMINLNRSKETESCRKSMGQGIRLIHSGGEVIIESLSKNVPLFVSSPNYNFKNNKPHDNLCLLEYGDSIPVFDYHDFAPYLAKCMTCSYEDVFKLQTWSVIRVSLQKGWGPNYKRQNPNETPVWLEIQLTGPLGWLDRILRRLDAPNTKCSSMT